MPEGPEIRRAADTVEKQVAGRIIDRIYFGLEPLKPWESRLTGLKIKRISTHGKAMVMHIGRDLFIYSHNQLYGRWRCCKSDRYPSSNRQLRMVIDCQDRSALLYSASDIAVLNSAQLEQHPFLSKLGPDVLDSTVTPDDIVARLTSDKFRNRRLGNILTDQSFVAGLGNYLRCEVLFVCGLDPRSRGKDLEEESLQALADAMLGLAKQSYLTGGITNDLERANSLMEQGASFRQARHHVYSRAGSPCYRCGSVINRSQGSGQAIYYCPQCQSVSS